MPEAVFEYPGIGDFSEVRYTLSHGISPGRITIRGAPDAIRPIAEGTAFFRYAGSVIQMPDCRFDRLTIEASGDGRSIARVEILDQRWRWRFGHISGEYNIRVDDGEAIAHGTEKTPQALAQLCLEAMGQRRFDVSKMPNQLRPYVLWDYKIPALALADLADACGCRVVLKIGGSVAIEPAGQGETLPITLAAIAGEAIYDWPETPAALKFVAAPNVYQMDFDLAPVAVEPNGDIVALDDVHYQPKPEGWKNEPVLELPNVEAAHRELAQSCVWKYYQIQPKFTLPGDPQQRENRIEQIAEVLPLLPHQVEADKLPDKTMRRRPPWVYGLFEKGAATFPQTRENEEPDPNLNDVPQDLYTRGFTVDHQRGLVIFTEPVFLHRQVDDNYEVHPAKLKLRIACQRRDKQTRGVVRWEVSPQKPARQTAALTILRDDIAREVYFNHKLKKVVSNEPDVKRQAEYYLQATAKELQASQPGTLTYDGFWPIQPDGAIRQVSWIINSSGKGSTIVSRNREDDLVEMSYRERRLLERVVEMSRTERRREQRGERR
ncbi:hypothetical protein M4951_14595 [Blastopirellula sp. J2-11]|uniref:hypothetical protein n=1 Tax=Blastopirellula sp. J2-11 TaxID=2943192 RepID=UPI0021CA1584|nr:hypothetical protein [Blastopirellula sp. J2-11]UUO04619.1 hypothetical protein M4951_14595 [Blastopirellula sp. J2-11]